MPQNTTFQFNSYINPTPQSAAANMEAVRLQNEGQRLERTGDYTSAEARYLRAILIRNQTFGEGNTYAAINQNSLGELYIKMGKFDRAEIVLKEALKVRETMTDFDAAVTRENLAQVYEARGDLRNVKAMREKGLPDKMVCSNTKACDNPYFAGPTFP
ncbi:hypothetical protein K488DRAFT_87100 [Vararia minispora EC-137]|uniref:Uncharacterized protein n=1 Tax=Vararia minispora EC-137 TaxID=1314806 RepID=A0ACB8QH65_9AGAM|nr:hypothetical protein K488DRAFT_87100 [Vararia minispora EC-137]